MPNAAHSSSRANTELTETRAQLSGKERTRGSFCPLSRTWGQAQGSQFFIKAPAVGPAQFAEAAPWRSFLFSLCLWAGEWAEGILPQDYHTPIRLRQCIQDSERANESPESFILSPAQGMLLCVPSPVHVYFLIFEYLTGVRSCCCPFRCWVSCSSSISWCKILGKLPAEWWKKWRTSLIMDVINAWAICFIHEVTWWS